jgi:hypothetical protein
MAIVDNVPAGVDIIPAAVHIVPAVVDLPLSDGGCCVNVVALLWRYCFRISGGISTVVEFSRLFLEGKSVRETGHTLQ